MTRRYWPFKILEVIGQSAVRVEPASNVKVYPVIHVEYTSRARTQPEDVANPQPDVSQPSVDYTGELVPRPFSVDGRPAFRAPSETSQL